jgi:hypothetical protein
MGIDQPMITDETLFERVNVGHETMAFVRNTPIGRSMLERAVDEYKYAVMDFEELSIPTIMKYPEQVVAIKQRMEVAISFLKWMNETLSSADGAEEELKQRDMSDETID